MCSVLENKALLNNQVLTWNSACWHSLLLQVSLIPLHSMVIFSLFKKKRNFLFQFNFEARWKTTAWPQRREIF